MAAAGATIAGVPALVRFRGSPEAAAGHGTVLYYHGFGGDKGRCEPYLTALNEESCQRLVVWFERWLPGG